METIKPTTKTGRKYLNMYYWATCENIFRAYKTPSTNKTRADYQCRQQMIKENGHGCKIIAHSCHFFTVAWRTAQGLRVETANRSILVTI